jgi:hypothetical protein
VTRTRLDPAGRLAISLEKGLLKWVLSHPDTVSLEELEDWVLEFQDEEFKGLLEIIIGGYREHGLLDHGLLIQNVEDEPLRQQICALTLGEEEDSGPEVDLLTADWRRDLCMRRLKRARQALKERLAKALTEGGEEVTALLAQQQEIHRQLESLKIRPTAKGENG